MHQMGWIGHLTGGNVAFFSADMATMAPETKNEGYRIRLRSTLRALAARARAILTSSLASLALSFAASVLAIPALQAQSGGNQSQPPANSQPAQDIPDAPSTVQPPAPKLPAAVPPESGASAPPAYPGEATGQQPDQNKQAPPPMPPVETIPAGSRPRNQINPNEDLYTIRVPTTLVQIPVMVKDSDGRRVDGLLPKDFTVLENGKKQTLSYFSSDPFELSVAVLLDIGMPDVAVQKMNQSYSALIGAFSPYDEVAIYTYSSTVSQVTDYTGRPERLTAALNQMKLVRGGSGGPPVLSGPFTGGPAVNGAPVGGGGVAPVNTPDRESHVLN